MPHNSVLQRIIVFSDASLDVVAYAIYLEVRHPDLSISCDFLSANAYTRHASIPSLEMLAFVIGLSELHNLISRHSISLLPESMVRVDFLLDSECTLHSLNINKLSKIAKLRQSCVHNLQKTTFVCTIATDNFCFQLLTFVCLIAIAKIFIEQQLLYGLLQPLQLT